MYWLIAAVMAQILTYTFGAMTYHTLLRIFKQENLMGKWALFKATLIEIFLNQSIPSGGLSGNAYIFNLLARRKMAVLNITSLIVLELLAFYFAMGLIVLAALFTGTFIYPIKFSFLIVLAIGLLVYILLCVAMSLIGKKQTISWVYGKLKKISFVERLVRKMDKQIPGGISINDMQNPWPLIRQNPASMTRAVFYLLCVQIVDAFTIYAFFYGLGAPLDFHAVIIGLTLTKIISIVPISPGSLVLYESSMSFFYHTLGAALSVAVVVTLLYRVLSFWLPLPIGFFMLDSLKPDKKAKSQEIKRLEREKE